MTDSKVGVATNLAGVIVVVLATRTERVARAATIHILDVPTDLDPPTRNILSSDVSVVLEAKVSASKLDPVECTIHVLHDADGNIVGFLGVDDGRLSREGSSCEEPSVAFLSQMVLEELLDMSDGRIADSEDTTKKVRLDFNIVDAGRSALLGGLLVSHHDLEHIVRLTDELPSDAIVLNDLT